MACISSYLKYEHLFDISSTFINPNVHADTVKFYEVYVSEFSLVSSQK